ncbi:MAG: hypothetical protein Q7U75_06500, partial [Desulfobacterales bacterium]|nr:hypothetical protein [Desulfobacterales bacterium]
GGPAQRLTAAQSDDVAPTYSRDWQWIYMASNRSGRSEIWRISAVGGEAEQVTRNGGYFAIESWDRKTLYYNNATGRTSELSPLMAKSLEDGRERIILAAVYARSFVPVEDGIYYLGQALADRQYPLLFHHFATGRATLLTTVENPPALGLTVSPDRRTFLFAVGKPVTFDLMMIENFK